jgi:hypothetical protein
MLRSALTHSAPTVESTAAPRSSKLAARHSRRAGATVEVKVVQPRPSADNLLRLRHSADVARDLAGRAENASLRSRLCPSLPRTARAVCPRARMRGDAMTEKTTSEKTTAAPRPAPLPAELDTGSKDSTIRPFRIDVPEDALAQQGARRRSLAGSPARAAPGARGLLGNRLRLAQGRGEAERAPAVHDRDRRREHPLHPRQVAA